MNIYSNEPGILQGFRSNGAAKTASALLHGVGMKPSLLINYTEELPNSLETGDLLVLIGGWGGEPDNPLKQRLASLINRPFEIHEPFLAALKKSYPDDEAFWSYAIVPERALHYPNRYTPEPTLLYEQGKGAILVLPNHAEAIREAWQAGLGEKLRHLFSSFNRTYEGVFWLAEAPNVEELELSFRAFRISVEPVGKLFRLSAYYTSPPLPNPDEHFDDFKKHLQEVYGDAYLKIGSDLALSLFHRLKERSETIAFAESCTGGKLSETLTAHAGVSAIFLGAVVAYSNAAKETLLGVPCSLIEEKGAVSVQVAEAMAKGVKEKFKSDWALATTGIAGPDGGTAEKPVGTVWVSLQGPQGISETWNVKGSGGRAEIIFQAVQSAYIHLFNKL